MSSAVDLPLDAAVVRNMLDAAPDASVLCDQDGYILFVNRQTELLFGYDRADLLGQPVELLLPESLRAGHQAHRKRFAADPSVRPMGQDRRLAARRRDGSTFPVEIALSPLSVDSHHLALASIRDITERLAAEAHTRYVQQLLDGTSDGVYVMDHDGSHFEYVNQGAVEQTGYDRQELIDLTVSDLVISGDGRYHEAVKPLLRGEQHLVRLEDLLQHRDGSLIPVELSLSYPVREDGQHRVVAVARDVSERHVADTERRKAETAMALADERERVARDLHDTVIQELFAAGMTLEATLARVPDEQANQRINDVVDQIDAAIRHLRTSIFARRASNASSATHSLTDAVNGLVAELNRILPEAAVAQLSGPLDAPRWGFAHPDLLASLRECLTNVARHAEARHVEVVVSCDDRMLGFEILDDGKGMPERIDGAGNGLINATHRAERHGGSFEMASRSPQGTRARWSVPAINATLAGADKQPERNA